MWTVVKTKQHNNEVGLFHCVADSKTQRKNICWQNCINAQKVAYGQKQQHSNVSTLLSPVSLYN